jgi:hypothetical protein
MQYPTCITILWVYEKARGVPVDSKDSRYFFYLNSSQIEVTTRVL